MKHHFDAVIMGLFVLLFVANTGAGMAVAQQGNEIQDPTAAPLMCMASAVSGSSGPAANEPADSREFLLDRLDLKMYEAAAGDLSLCADDKRCLEGAKEIKSWACVAAICDGTDKSKIPTACFEGASDKFSKEVLDRINSLACALIKTPSTKTRRALLPYLLNTTENDLVVDGAYLLALKRSAVSCENYIKGYVGAYGPQWTYQWYRALSGCRILARERTLQQEEKDFYTWFGVVLRGLGNCSDIINSEMRQACNAPAASPVPAYVQ